MSRLLAICLIGMWSACSINGAAAEPLFLPHQSNEVELVKGPVRRLIVVTKETIATLSFSRPGELTEKITVHRDDAADAPGETTLYRYNATGQRTGEYIVGDEGELVPMRLYAYGDNGQVFANAAYHQCRTFSALHLYIYDGSGRLVRNVEFASRRLTKRDFQYDQQGRIERTATYRNGRLLSLAHYTYDDRGRIATVVSEQPDGAGVDQLYRYDEYGNRVMFVETYRGDSAQDKTEVTTYEYDARGNWTRRTIIRVVNPLDENGQPLEEPVQVVEREILYADDPG